MAYLPAAQRTLDVVSPVTIYRQIGRRPSQVYVDDAMTAAAVGRTARHRLKDRVYWRTRAEPGSQIQDRPGGTLVVTATGECYPVLLAEPTPLTPATAFSHADLAIKADQSAIDQLVAAGSLVAAAPRRRKRQLSRPADRMFEDDHPLVVDALPAGVTPSDDGAPVARFGSYWARGARSSAR